MSPQHGKRLAHDRSDFQAVRDGFVSLAPRQPDLTAYDAMTAAEELKELAVRSRVEAE